MSLLADIRSLSSKLPSTGPLCSHKGGGQQDIQGLSHSLGHLPIPQWWPWLPARAPEQRMVLAQALGFLLPTRETGMEFWVPVFGEHVGECSLPYTSFKDSFGREIALPSTGSLPK